MLSLIDARRAAIALLGRWGEVAIAAAVFRAQEAESRGRYEEMASWRRIAAAAFEYTEYFDYVVVRSGSCVHHVRDNLDAIEKTDSVRGNVEAAIFEKSGHRTARRRGSTLLSLSQGTSQDGLTDVLTAGG